MNVDKWHSRKYTNALFFGYPLEGILKFMRYKGDLVFLKIDLKNIPLYFDAGFDSEENRYKDFDSFVCFENIDKNRILEIQHLKTDLENLKISDKIAENLLQTIIKNYDFWKGSFVYG